LELFVTVCQAVQHAHQKGIIHRDLKPTNVLVAMQDGQPAPKIIDFGVAKAIDQQLTEHTLTTAFAPMLGTPLYMSPEQAELSPLGVDTRSDIYSLGVMLYELLTGATPFDKDRLHAVSYDELRRIIREEDPPRPSARISTLAADLATTVAERRRTDARRLSQQVRGELDWIVMKCLEKDRNRRYETPSSLARDIERYLADEPVQACPPSAGYRFKKFAMRNKTFLSAGGAIAAAIVVGLGLATWQYFRARTESARAKAVSDLLQEMLASSNPDEVKGATYTVRELLDDFAAGLGDQLAREPEVEAAIRTVIGKSYWRLGVHNRAELNLKKALQLRSREFGAGDERVADNLVDYAWSLAEQGRNAKAEQHARDALSIYRQQGSDPHRTIRALWSLQQFLNRQSRYSDAEQVANDALALVSQHKASEFAELPNILHGLADAKVAEKKYEEAEKWARQAIDLHRRLHGDNHPETAFALSVLANAQRQQQKLADAEATARESLRVFRRAFPQDHRNIRNSNYQLRSVLEARGDASALNALAKEEAEQAIRSYTPAYRIRLAELLLASRKPTDAQKEEARRHIRQSIQENSQVLVDFHDELYRRQIALEGFASAIGACAVAQGFADLVDELHDRLEVELPKFLADFDNSGDSQWWAAVIYRSLGSRLYVYGKHLPTADRAFSEAKDILEKLSIAEPNRYGVWLQLADTYCWLGECKWRLDKREEAAASFRRAMDLYDERAAEIAAPIEAPINIVWDKIYMAYYLVATQREDEAPELAREAADAAKLLTDPVASAQAHFALALLQARLGEHAGYRETCQALLDVDFASASDLTKVQTIWAWCVAPDALAEMNLVVKHADEFTARNPFDLPHGDHLLGVALYRAGEYERAAPILEQSIEVYPNDPPPNPGAATIHFQRLFLAMTKWRLGRHDDARRLLAEAQAAIDEELKPPALTFEFCMPMEALRREAEALIVPKDANEAVESKTSTNDEPNHPQPNPEP
jgi:tetratricopeptide (TPR) repeat protein